MQHDKTLIKSWGWTSRINFSVTVWEDYDFYQDTSALTLGTIGTDDSLIIR